MKRIVVDTGRMDQRVPELQRIAGDLQRVSERMSTVSSRLRWDTSVTPVMRTRISQQQMGVDQLQKKMGSLSAVLSEISAEYQKAEGENQKTGASSASPGSQITSSGKVVIPENLPKHIDVDLIWKLIAGGGIIGSTLKGIRSIWEMITGGVTPNGVMTFGKDLAKIAENIGKSIPKSGAKFDWKTLFGFNSPITNETSKNFWMNLKDSASKLNPGNAKTVGDKVAVYAKWAGYGLTALIKGYENFNDPENATLARKIAETAGETLVDIGEGMLIGAGVAAAAAAVGLAPGAIVIGGATVLVKWGLDKAFEAVTGKDSTEFISDAVIDGSKALYEGGKKIVKGIGKAVKSTGDVIKGWWNSWRHPVMAGSW